MDIFDAALAAKLIGIPKPSAADAGKVPVVGPDGKYRLGEGGGGTEDYNELINKPISLTQPEPFTQDSSIGTGVFMGNPCTKVSNETFAISQLLGGTIKYRPQGESENEDLSLSTSTVVDIVSSVSALGYSGNVLTCITPSGNWQNLDFLMFSLDSAWSLINYGIDLEAGTYILPNVVELTLPETVVVNEHYANSFLPTATEADNGKFLEVGNGKWGLASGTVKGCFDYENILTALYQIIFGPVSTGTLINNGLAGSFPLYSQIRAHHKELGELVFDVVGYYLEDDENGNVQKLSIRLLLHGLLPGFEFDATEALCICDNGLAAGTYYIDWSNNDQQMPNASLNNKPWCFTLDNDVPAGGVLVFSLNLVDWCIGDTISSYSAIGDLTPIETAALDNSQSGEELSTIAGVRFNYSARAVYGSGNFAQSGIYKYLSGSGDNWWTPSTDFDRPPSYVNKPGFLSGLEPKFLEILSNETRVFATNHYYEDGYALDSSYTLTSKFALPSRTQMGFGNNGYNADVAEGEVFTAYGNSVPSELKNAFRIKNMNGNPTWYWMASCRPWTPSDAWAVRTDGGDGNNNAAYPSYGLAPVCSISAILS